MSAAAQKRYKVDLQGYQAICEANYMRLSKLVCYQHDHYAFDIELRHNQHVVFSLAIRQRCRFTTMIDVYLEGAASWLGDTHFELRVYHDAAMVEVVGFQKQRAIAPVYAYPNKAMLQRDEKLQQQQFLADCLNSCLGHGMSQKSLSFA